MTTQPASSPPGASPPGGDWHEPSDAELAGCWPDPFAGPPEDGDAWLDGVTAADLDALLGPGRALPGRARRRAHPAVRRRAGRRTAGLAPAVRVAERRRARRGRPTRRPPDAGGCPAGFVAGQRARERGAGRRAGADRPVR